MLYSVIVVFWKGTVFLFVQPWAGVGTRIQCYCCYWYYYYSYFKIQICKLPKTLANNELKQKPGVARGQVGVKVSKNAHII